MTVPIPADIQQAYEDGRIPDGISLEYLAENRDYGPVVAILFVGILTFMIVSFRIYGRIFLVRKFGLDDWLAVLAMLLYIVFMVLSIMLLHLGSGRHMEYIMYVLTVDHLSETEALDFVGHIIYAVQLYVARMSGLAFYQRLSDRHETLQMYIKIGGGFITAATLPQLFLIVFHCLPVTSLWPYEWQEEFKNYECMPWGTIYTTNSALSLMCDFVVFAIPAALIMMLKTSRSSKFKLSLILFPGVIVIAISIARIYLVVRGGWDVDGSWFYSPQLAVQNAELGGTLLALSVPGLKPLFGTLFDKLGSRTSQSTTPTNGATTCRNSTANNALSKKQLSMLSIQGDQKLQGWERMAENGHMNASNDSLLTESDVGSTKNGAGSVLRSSTTNEASSTIALHQLKPHESIEHSNT